MSLFHHVSFRPIDPLGDGLREEIAAEQQESDAIEGLEEGLDEQELSAFWTDVEKDVENDPTWFHLSED
ncbi:MAG: hypothetical protein JWP06_48 [Candidatus Saccharibacteria bacterium]|nr:hypothetical protein [Candidatus Saccharibacteria bacterium]